MGSAGARPGIGQEGKSYQAGQDRVSGIRYQVSVIRHTPNQTKAGSQRLAHTQAGYTRGQTLTRQSPRVITSQVNRQEGTTGCKLGSPQHPASSIRLTGGRGRRRGWGRSSSQRGGEAFATLQTGANTANRSRVPPAFPPGPVSISSRIRGPPRPVKVRTQRPEDPDPEWAGDTDADQLMRPSPGYVDSLTANVHPIGRCKPAYHQSTPTAVES
ncbi:hypothetical protein B0T17DRAFT_506583 [Bombardia bombarda]|uniref:Uncharacterized protein n=1 Tax=Bombardia bombarda TaxID=252184 RepID=A0AA39XAX6_9PEZI|nr:hypothetical protein B0T17DRAFT_506583 [Bombardia bombarda]